MLPIEPPPYSSCSLDVPAVVVRSDERSFDRGTLPEPDPTASRDLARQKSTTHFSIRDYALTSRSKDIQINWPFRREYLQVCLKHGVKDVLPPFEPPDLVRANCSTKGKISEQLVICIDDVRRLKSDRTEKKSINTLDILSEEKQPEKHLLSNTSCLESSSITPCLAPLKSKSEVSNQGFSSKNESGMTCGETKIKCDARVHDLGKAHQILPCEVPQSDIGSVTNSEVSTTLEESVVKVLPLPERLNAVHKASQKKCKLVLKVGSSLEPLRSSDISSNSITVSDSMASKVCPVCKTFSSTSNTTLNAHIDQCLFENTNDNLIPSKLLNHKASPSKKRLMVDIYANAARCTLEDLDKRNGTTWSLDLRSIAPTNMITTETKRSKICPIPSNDNDNDGAVYVNSSGTKVCVLSKLNSKPLDAVGQSSVVKTQRKEFDKRHKIFFCKRKGVVPKFSNEFKAKLQGKKSGILYLSTNKVNVASEDKLPEDFDLGMKGRSLQKSSPKPKATNCRIATLRQRIRSIKSRPMKRLNDKRGHDLLRKQVVKAVQSDLVRSSATKSNAGNLHGPVIDNLLKTKSMKILSGKLVDRDCSDNHYVSPENSAMKLVSGLSSKCHSVNLKVPRSLEGSSSSPKMQTVDIPKKVVKKPENMINLVSRSTQSYHVNLAEEKHTPNSTVCPSLSKSSFLSEDTCNSQKAQFASKKLRSPRTARKFGKITNETRCVVNYEFHEEFDVPSASNHQALAIGQSNLCEEMLNESEVVYRQQTSHQSTCTARVECKSSEKTEVLGGCHNPDRKSTGMLTDYRNDTYNGGNSQFNVSPGNYANTETAPLHNYDGNMDTDSGLCENQKLIGGTEAWVELFASRSSSNNHLHSGDEGNDMMMDPNSEVGDEMDFGGRNDASSEVPYIEFQNDHISASNARPTSKRTSCLDIPQEHSCVTSNRNMKNDDHNIITQKETSRSPISDASTISHPYSGNSKIQEKKLSAINDYPRAEFHDNFELPSTLKSVHDGTASIRKQIQGYEPNVMVHDGPNLWEKQSCCCSKRGNVPHESWYYSTRSNLDKLVVMPSTSCFSSMTVAPSCYRNCADTHVETKSDNLISPRSNEPFGYRTYKDFGSSALNTQIQSQSSPKAVLRLMGKNLTVTNEDEHLPLSKDSPSSKNKPESEGHQPSILGFSSNENFPNLSNHQFRNDLFIGGGYKSMGYSRNPSPQVLPFTSFMGTTRQDQINTHQRRVCEASGLPFTYNEKGVLLRHQHQECLYPIRLSDQPREILTFYDSPDPKIFPRGGHQSKSTIYSNAHSGPCPKPTTPSCTRTPYTYLPRDLSYTPNPGFSVSYLRSNNVHSMVQRNPSEDPFAVPSSLSAGHLTPTFFYSPSLQQGR